MSGAGLSISWELTMFYSMAFVAALACIGLFYTIGEQEEGAGLLWGGISIVLSMLVIVPFQGGTGAVFLVQLLFFVGIAVFRLWRDPD